MAEEKTNATPLFSENQSKPPVDQKLNTPRKPETKMQLQPLPGSPGPNKEYRGTMIVKVPFPWIQ